MEDVPDDTIRGKLELVYRTESRQIFATLVRAFGDFDAAEEALHEAFAAALTQWPRDGMPSSPRAWLVTVGRARGIDALRRRRRLERATPDLQATTTALGLSSTHPDEGDMADDRLQLLFTCCRPELPADSQVALTLRELCGLTTEEIARAYLTRPSTIAQRIVRAKQRLREQRVPFELPRDQDLQERSAQVMRTIYLVFNEGYSASAGPSRIRVDLCAEAIQLARLLVGMLPDAESLGLLALLLLQDARRGARVSPTGDLVLLADQDRSQWDRQRIAEGTALVEEALKSDGAGAYALEAAIAAVYAESIDGGPIDWAQIVALHDELHKVAPSPVGQLARAIALGGRDGPAAGLRLVEILLEQGIFASYVPAHAARADLCERLERTDDAIASFRKALELTQQEAERRHFLRALERLESKR